MNSSCVVNGTKIAVDVVVSARLTGTWLSPRGTLLIRPGSCW